LIASTHRRLNFTAIIVTHEVPDIFPIVHRVALLHDGRILATGTPESFMESDHPVVRAFFPDVEGMRTKLSEEGGG
jgi:phospholipid/cholesterol/gamma-HCH transport system ATP-binding protein